MGGQYPKVTGWGGNTQGLGVQVSDSGDSGGGVGVSQKVGI